MNTTPVIDPWAPLHDDLGPLAEQVRDLLTQEGPTLTRGAIEHRIVAPSRELGATIRAMRRAGMIRTAGVLVTLVSPSVADD